MAQRAEVQLIDDMDGSQADTTVEFGYDGRNYEIDLTGKHADQMRKAFAPYIDRGRRVTARRRMPSRSMGGRDRSREIRSWAMQHGMSVSERGRIPASVIAAYEARDSEPAAKPRRSRSKAAIAAG